MFNDSLVYMCMFHRVYCTATSGLPWLASAVSPAQSHPMWVVLMEIASRWILLWSCKVHADLQSS